MQEGIFITSLMKYYLRDHLDTYLTVDGLDETVAHKSELVFERGRGEIDVQHSLSTYRRVV